MKKLLFIVWLFTAISVNLFSQGKIITKEEANNLFGPVLKSVAIETMEIRNLLPKSQNVLMFQIIDNEIFILDGKRNILLPAGKTLNNGVVFSVYSKDVIQELFNLGQSQIAYFEKRELVLTITVGLYTMEFSIYCPPICPD